VKDRPFPLHTFPIVFLSGDGRIERWKHVVKKSMNGHAVPKCFVCLDTIIDID
jgi:hypothetical protein